MAREDHALCFSRRSNDAFDFIAKPPGADQQKANPAIIGQQRDCFRQSQYAVPGPERADETCEYFIFPDSQFAANDSATNVRTNRFCINAVWINDYLFIRDPSAQQIAPLDF